MSLGLWSLPTTDDRYLITQEPVKTSSAAFHLDAIAETSDNPPIAQAPPIAQNNAPVANPIKTEPQPKQSALPKPASKTPESRPATPKLLVGDDDHKGGQRALAALPPLVDRAGDDLAAGVLQKPAGGGGAAGEKLTEGRAAGELWEGRVAGELWEGNGLKMKFRWCPAGQFMMGSPNSEPERLDIEGPVTVRLTRGFWMAQYDVTQAQWQSLMVTTLADQQTKAQQAKLYGQGARYPMHFVNHDEATEFCRELTASERDAGRLPNGWEFRLPTEAQWEYACRAGTTTATAFGNTLSSKQANFNGSKPYNGAAEGPYLEKMCEVGSYKANAWGLHDMHGNVFEWCRDWYEETLSGGRDPDVSQGASARVLRGGSWSNLGRNCRSALRGRDTPGYRNNNAGFRLATVQSRGGAAAEKLTEGRAAGELWEGNGLKMKFRWCPAGQFMMGSPKTEPERLDREGPVTVSLTRGFWIAQYEVTQEEWQTLMVTTIAHQQPKAKYPELYGQGARYPTYFVSHDEATEFCRELTTSEREAGRLPEGWEFRLPTEAQWEYACRAGTTTATAFGDNLSSKQANFDGSNPYNGAAKGLSLQKTCEVGSYQANAWGLHDMHGNVFEWCRDWYARTLPGGRDPEFSQRAFGRVIRGGSWSDYGRGCRSANRVWRSYEFWDGDLDFRGNSVGFRLATVQSR